MMPRGIDHLVVAVRDLEASRSAYRRLGFTLTPVARHPFGTANSLVQLGGNFLELLAVADPARIAEPTSTAFSFAAVNRDYLRRREGLSMLVLKSRDAAADRADFVARGLRVFEPFGFERLAKSPDGAERKVAFSLTFTGDRRIPDAGFFTCQHHFPENFWRPEFQRHANGARAIEAAIMVARDPADFHEFLTYFTGQHDMVATSLGITIDSGDGKVEVMTPVAVRAFFGAAVDVEDDPAPRFVACRIAVDSLERTRAALAANAVPFAERMGAVVVPAGAAGGMAIAFVERGG